MDPEQEPRGRMVLADVEVAAISAISVLGAATIATTLRTGAAAVPDDETKRRELIAAVRAGQHVELEITATVFRQKDGVPNRKGVRVSPDALETFAASFVGMPMLVDHDQRTQASRIGTVMSSELSTHGGTGWSSITQRLRVVKPDAVISVLDGTIDRFSVGFIPGSGDVICSLHRTSILTACRCWALDEVDLDGTSATAEWEFTKPDGVETSSVNVPAVTGTGVKDVRQALALALDIAPRHLQPPAKMNFTRLMAILGLASLANAVDEDRAIAAIEDLRRGKLAAEQERDTARAGKSEAEAKLALAETAAEEARLAAEDTQVTALIDSAYRDGKLGYSRNAEDPEKALPSPREPRLRRIAKEKDGLAALRAELAEMPVVIPVAARIVSPADPTPRGPTLDTDVGDQQLEAELVATSKKTGQDINQLRAEAARIRNRRQGA